ncbi:FHA domain-containing protein [Thermodesulfobacteriota bacterium]
MTNKKDRSDIKNNSHSDIVGISDDIFCEEIDAETSKVSEASSKKSHDVKDGIKNITEIFFNYKKGIKENALDAAAKDIICRLTIVSGPMKSHSFEIKDEITFIGRSRENDIKINDSTISRRHVKIFKKNNKFFIEDLGSHNGLMVDGNRVKPGEEIELIDGVSYSIGDSVFSIENLYPEYRETKNRKLTTIDNGLVIDDSEFIKSIITDMISKKEPINFRIKGNDTNFTSRFLKIDDESLFSTIYDRPNLIIEKLVPEKGNQLIQSVSEVDVEFLFRRCPCRCSLRYHGISSFNSNPGFTVRLPEYIEIIENRKDPRSIYEIMEFVSVEFCLNNGPEKDKKYNLDIIDCSKQGLGLLITKKNFKLAKILKKNYRIPKVAFYSEEAMIKVDGTVKHITKIKDGKHKGSYRLGLNSSAIIKGPKPSS